MIDMILLGIAAVANFVALTFFCASMAAASYHYSTLQQVPWAKVAENGLHVYLGFRAAAASVELGNGLYTQVIHLNNCSEYVNDDGVCAECGTHNGNVIMALVAAALGFSFFSLLVTATRFSHSKCCTLKVFQLCMMVVSFACGIAAFSYFTRCHQELEDTLPNNSVSYGPGFGLDVCASFLMFIAFVIGCISCGDTSESAATANPVVNKSEPVPTKDVEIVEETKQATI